MKRSCDKKGVAGRGSRLSPARTYAKIGVFWGEHDLPDYWDSTCPVQAQVRMKSEESLYAVVKGLSDTIRREAKECGVWLQEKVQKLKPRPQHG